MTDSFVVFEPLYSDVVTPARATAGSAGYDLRAYLTRRRVRFCSADDGVISERTVASDDSITIAPAERALLPLGFRARVPEGYEAQLRIRSSVAFKKGLTLPNAPGTIDSDYPDEWLVMMRNDSRSPVRIEHGERIAQVVIARYAALEWKAGVVATTTRSGGLGSTGQ
ncbi:MAG: dUTP diphosphatase [Gemmatimonadaceae bacterium]